ncbi:hypothetical protein BpHYR1_048421 [Brachionus plicatilis]|uniref:Uncharacterized protein n=1 Tax=Brachionus plicatilis TaxID=10195 RepID=A0A3M7Q727_BRAPC|nr:hypothetical protein BpHYR1_048421 [Brachionus plicatilis]
MYYILSLSIQVIHDLFSTKKQIKITILNRSNSSRFLLIKPNLIWQNTFQGFYSEGALDFN